MYRSIVNDGDKKAFSKVIQGAKDGDEEAYKVLKKIIYADPKGGKTMYIYGISFAEQAFDELVALGKLSGGQGSKLSKADSELYLIMVTYGNQDAFSRIIQMAKDGDEEAYNVLKKIVEINLLNSKTMYFFGGSIPERAEQVIRELDEKSIPDK